MTEIIVTNCVNCPFGMSLYCWHPKADKVGINLNSIPDDCPLIKEETIIKVNK